jgi:hypothetical protein
MSDTTRIPPRWPFRSDGHKALPVEPIYPGHAPAKSAKFCVTCMNRRKLSRQKRRSTVVGPMAETDCDALGVQKRGPRCSDHWFFQFILWRWLLSHPTDRSSMWFIIRVRAECPTCDESHEEKEYARQFNKFRRMLIHGQRFVAEVLPHFRIFSVE